MCERRHAHPAAHGLDRESSGSYTVRPEETTTYGIVATGPGGTTTASATVTVHQPPAVSISADPLTIYAGQAATLFWTSTGADQVTLDNGIGALASSGSLPVSPNRTTTYTVTATGPGGTAAAAVTITVNSVITLHIDAPAANSIIDRPDVLVTGTVSHAYGHETGVSVNGIPAMIHGNRFVANHVPLEDGENEIAVTARDLAGNSAELRISVVSEVTGPYITLTMDDSAGVSPFDTLLRVESCADIIGVDLTDTGSGAVEYTDGTETHERFVHVSDEGVYFISAEVSGGGTVLTDTIGIVVHDRNELDGLLRGNGKPCARRSETMTSMPRCAMFRAGPDRYTRTPSVTCQMNRGTPWSLNWATSGSSGCKAGLWSMTFRWNGQGCTARSLCSSRSMRTGCGRSRVFDKKWR